jgi:spore maturation protein SpmA
MMQRKRKRDLSTRGATNDGTRVSPQYQERNRQNKSGRQSDRQVLLVVINWEGIKQIPILLVCVQMRNIGACGYMPN